MINLAFDIGESLPLDDRDREIDLSQQSRIDARLIELPDPPADINTELQIIHQQNQSQVEAIDAKILQIKQLKFRTQQLAKHSKNQLDKAVAMLSSIEQIRTEIVSSLDKFGGYAEIHQMLGQLEATRQILAVAHEQSTTEKEVFRDSLKAIQLDVVARSHESEQKLSQYQESISSLSQIISSDRLQIVSMNLDVGTKLTDLDRLSTQITNAHTQIVETSRTMQSGMREIDQRFKELSVSVQTEKEQFYELTAETIEKADLIQSQLIEVVKQIGDDRQQNAIFRNEIELVRSTAKTEIDQQLNDFEIRQGELISICNNFKVRQKHQIITAKKISTWLWILSVAVVGMLILLVRILFIKS